jgi:transcriptional regulator with GAF, ATPase, and Fis domain
MSGEELYGRRWRDLARKEGHKPMHLVALGRDAKAAGGAKKGARGATAELVRQLCERGATIKEAAAELGLSPSTVHDHARRMRITFADGRAA